MKPCNFLQPLLELAKKYGQRHCQQISSICLDNRAGLFETDEEYISTLTICPKHRIELSTGWLGKKRATCGYPTHKGKRKQMRDPRRLNITVSYEIFKLHHNVVVPAGTAWCDECRKHHNQLTKTGQFNTVGDKVMG
ncbi:hypothetical protein AC249_AIPGENE26973 [Exaiptasia diaphana]|nr:hypothetical protein AC249_AIPGENE26973 [Exaiptasia diaphana]